MGFKMYKEAEPKSQVKHETSFSSNSLCLEINMEATPVYSEVIRVQLLNPPKSEQVFSFFYCLLECTVKSALGPRHLLLCNVSITPAHLQTAVEQITE